jgi:hypothetical protein
VLHALGEDDESVRKDSTADVSIAGHFQFSGRVFLGRTL